MGNAQGLWSGESAGVLEWGARRECRGAGVESAERAQGRWSGERAGALEWAAHTMLYPSVSSAFCFVYSLLLPSVAYI